jgi:hypothetical protein
MDHNKHVLEVHAISEAKAGQGAAKGLTSRRTALGKRRDPITGRTPFEELKKVAAEDLEKINAVRAKDGKPPLDVTPDEWARELQKETEAGGQPRSVLERMLEGEGDEKLGEAVPKELLVDGVPFRVEMSKKSQFLIATPGGVDVKDVPADLAKENITAKLLPVNMNEKQVGDVFAPLTVVVEAAAKAAKVP